MRARSQRNVVTRTRAGEPPSIEAQLGRYIVPQDDGCWVWTGKLNSNGYGQMPRIVNGTKLAHRWVYETCFGPVPPRRHVHHRCGNRACCNPLHLVALSAADHGWAHQDNRFMAKGQPEP